MPPKKKYSKEMIISSAFELIRSKGIQNISARSIAGELNMSVAPIYTYFSNMDDLKKELFNEANKLLEHFEKRKYSEIKFLNIGLANIYFAIEEKMLFRWIFTQDVIMQEYWEYITKKKFNEFKEPMRKMRIFQDTSDEQLKQIYQSIWIFTHGLASLYNSGVLKFIDQETVINYFKIFLQFPGFMNSIKKI